MFTLAKSVAILFFITLYLPSPILAGNCDSWRCSGWKCSNWEYFDWGCSDWYNFDGLKHVRIKVRRRVPKISYSLNKYGLYEVKDETKTINPVDSKEKIFELIGIDCISLKENDIDEK